MPPLDASQQQLLATLRQRLDADGEVERDLMQGGECLDDACLRRWLRADKFELDSAEQRLRDHAKWRVAMAPNGCIDEVGWMSSPRHMHGKERAAPQLLRACQPQVFGIASRSCIATPASAASRAAAPPCSKLSQHEHLLGCALSKPRKSRSTSCLLVICIVQLLHSLGQMFHSGVEGLLNHTCRNDVAVARCGTGLVFISDACFGARD